MTSGDTSRTSDEIRLSVWPSVSLYNPLESNHDVSNYYEVAKVLSEVEHPSPSTVQATSCTLTTKDKFNTFHKGQSSGTNEKTHDLEGSIERKRQLQGKQIDSQQRRGSRRESTKTNITDKRRRNKISERIRTLKALVPYCNKVLLCFCVFRVFLRFSSVLHFSVLELNLKHIYRETKHLFLAMPFSISNVCKCKFRYNLRALYISMGIGLVTQGHYMKQGRQQSFTMRPSIMQHGIPQFGSYVPVNYAMFSTSFSGFRPLMPPNPFPWGQPRPELYPQQLQFPSHASQSLYSTAPSSGTIISTTYSQGGSTVSGQPLFQDPVTSQGTE